MPKAGPDSRLLENLLKTEKTAQDSFKQWTKDATAASTALSAWAVADSGETPDLMETSMRIGTLLGTCAESQRTYIDALTSYRASLRDVLMREADIRTILRDREILVSRLISLSKKKPNEANRDLHAARLEEAKRELGACEATLKAEEWGLVGVKRRVLRDAFGMRMRSLGELGLVLEESAKSAIELLDQLGVESADGTIYNDFHASTDHDLGEDEYEPEHDVSHEGSIAPSHSASQVARKAAGYPASHASSAGEVDVHIPPAHMMQSFGDDMMIPNASRRTSTIGSVPATRGYRVPRNAIATQPVETDSSDDDKLGNRTYIAHIGGGADIAKRAKSPRPPKSDSEASDATPRPAKQSSTVSGRSFFSAFASLFKNRPPRSGYDSDDEIKRRRSNSRSGSGWRTRTDANMKEARKAAEPSRSLASRRKRTADSSDDEIDPKTLVRVVNAGGPPLWQQGLKKRDRSDSIASEIYNPPLFPKGPPKAMSDIGPPRPIMKKPVAPVLANNIVGADLSRSETVTSVATAGTAKKKKKRPAATTTTPSVPDSPATRTISGTDARYSTGTWVTKQPAARASASLMSLVEESGSPTAGLASQTTSRKYIGAAGVVKPKKKKAAIGSGSAAAPGLVSAAAIGPPVPTVTTVKSTLPTAGHVPGNALTLPTAPPRIGEAELPVLDLPSAPPRISPIDLLPSPPIANGITNGLAPPIAGLTDSSVLSRRKSVRIADDSGLNTPAAPSIISHRAASPQPPILRAASPRPDDDDATVARESKRGPANWSSRIGQGADDSSDEDDQGAQSMSAYSKARKAMSRAEKEAAAEKSKGKQKNTEI